MKKIMSVVVCFLIIQVLVQGHVNTYWTGNSSVDKTNWLIPQNWTAGVPGKYDHAIIHTATFFPIISTDIGQVFDLSVSWHNVSTTLTINAGGRIHVIRMLTLGHGDPVGGIGRLNMNGGYVNTSWLRVGENGNGRVNLYGGQIDADSIDFGQDIGSGTGLIEIRGGRLTLMDNKVAEVNSYIAANRIFAYSYNGRVYSDFHHTTPGRTTVMAIDSRFKAWKPFPSDKKKLTANPSPMILKWSAGDNAVERDIYVGTDLNAVTLANPMDTSGVFRGRVSATQYTIPEALSGNQTYYWRIDEVASGGAPVKGDVWSFTTAPINPAVDLYSDTWVGFDDLGREISGFDRCGPVRADRTVGMYYCVWHKRFPAVGPHNNTEIIEANPENPAFQYAEHLFWWGEPEAGYNMPDDRWQIRRNLSMLVDAGVDVLILEATNAIAYVYESLVVMDVLTQMKSEGLLTDMKVIFWTHTRSPATVTLFYNNIYALGLYPELWFYWQGKPLILGYPDGIVGWDDVVESVSPEIRNFFTWRKSWFDVQGNMQHEWQWADKAPQGYGYDSASDIAEEVPISPATHPLDNIGKSYQSASGGQPALNIFDLPVTGTEGHGLYFEQQSQRALHLDPQFLFITGWNEWIMGWYLKEPGVHDGLKLLGRPVANGEYYTVDAYNAEYNRDLEPMKGGYGDNYYYHVTDVIRRFKGVRPPQPPSGSRTIAIDGDFSDWQGVSPEFRDTVGDTEHRDWHGFGFAGRYFNTTGRNDIVASKVARDEQMVYFYVRTDEALTPHTGSNWMLLFINTDQNYANGWKGYNYVVNLDVVSESLTTLKYTAKGWNWTTVSNSIAYRYAGNQMEIAIPRALLGLTSGTDALAIDFHWVDTASISPKYKYEYAFSVNGSLQGWGEATNSIAGLTTGSGLLSFSVIGSDPYIHGAAKNMYAASSDYMKIRMRNYTAAGTAQIYWVTLDDLVFSESKSQVFSIAPNDTQLRDYTVDLSQHPEWKGVIRQFRLDIGNGETGLVEIDSVEFYPHPQSVDFGLDGDHAPNRKFNYRYNTAFAKKACDLLWLEGNGQSSDLDKDCRVNWRDLIVLAERWMSEYDLLTFSQMAEQWLMELFPDQLSKVLLADTFAAGLGNWTTDWTISTQYAYTGGKSARCGSNNNDLISPVLDLSPFEKALVTFRYRLNGVDSDDNLKIFYYNGTTYQEIRNISNDQENVWLYFTHPMRKTGTDAAFFHSGFRFKITGGGLDFGEEAWVDDVKIIGIK